MRTHAIFALAAAGLVSIFASACSNHSADKATLPTSSKQSSVAVRVTKPSSKLTGGISRVTGTVRSRNEATISAKVTAQITSLPVDVGDRVKAGQRLISLDARSTSIMLENARAAERLAKASQDSAKLELDRATALHSSGAVAEAAFDRAKTGYEASSAQLDQARAAVHNAQQLLSDTTIVAPFAGIVSARMRGRGDTVSGMPPTPVLSLVDPDHLEIRAQVPEALVSTLRLDQILTASVSPNNAKAKGKVRVIGTVVDPATRTVEVLADVTEPLDGSIRCNSLVTLDLGDGAELSGPFLPSNAMRSDDRGKFVFVVVNGKIERRDVDASQITPGMVIVKRGVGAEDAVVIGNADKLHAGDAATIIPE